jgi:hypothetical protein
MQIGKITMSMAGLYLLTSLAVYAQCQSGGPGSPSCTAPSGGCSVSCSYPDFYACCNGTGGGSSCTCVSVMS